MTIGRAAWIVSAGITSAVCAQIAPGTPPFLPPEPPVVLPSTIGPTYLPGGEIVRIEPTIVVPQAVAMVLAVSPGQPTPADAVRGLGGEDIAVPAGRLLAEGAFLSARSGALLRAPSGEWVFVSTADAQGVRNPPMVLLPCATLDELERSLDPLGGQSVTLSGQVLVYRNRNYLLTTLASLGARPGETGDVVAAAPAEGGVVDGASSDRAPGASDDNAAGVAGEDPRVAALLEQLRMEGERTSLMSPTIEGDDPDEARGRALLHDGRLVVRERGRIVRLAGGRAAFVRDQGVRGETRDAPRVLLPSATLTRIEGAIARTGESAPVILSGRLYAHDGTVYLLPISFQLLGASEVRGLQ